MATEYRRQETESRSQGHEIGATGLMSKFSVHRSRNRLVVNKVSFLPLNGRVNREVYLLRVISKIGDRQEEAK